MMKGLAVLLGLLCLTGPAGAMGSATFDLSWNAMGGGGGPIVSPSYRLDGTVGQVTGIGSSTDCRIHAGYWVFDRCGSLPIKPLPGSTKVPTDPDGDCIYEDLNANGRLDFADVVLYFSRMTWIGQNEPVAAFDLNANGRIDFADIVALFNEV